MQRALSLLGRRTFRSVVYCSAAAGVGVATAQVANAHEGFLRRRDARTTAEKLLNRHDSSNAPLPSWWHHPELLRNAPTEPVGLFESVCRAIVLLSAVLPLLCAAPLAWLCHELHARLRRTTPALQSTPPPAADGRGVIFSIDDEWWWRWLLRVAGGNGAALTKFAQWAATRRDVFPAKLCERLSRLHANAPAHRAAHTAALLRSELGEAYSHRLLLAPKPIGSGCVAQVHRAVLSSVVPGAAAAVLPPVGLKEVAVKVVHPGVKRQVEVDVRLLWAGALLVDALVPAVRAAQLVLCVEEFSQLLLNQMDLRVEATNLARFGRDFRDDSGVLFPEPVAALCSEHVLVESYIDGEPLELEREEGVRRRLARRGVRTYLRMLFRHSFVHGDLHPGNVRQTKSAQLAILDGGIAIEVCAEERRNLVDLFRAVVERNGVRAGELMIERSHSHVSPADAERFCRGVAEIVDDAHANGLQLARLGVAELLSRVLSLCYRHQVQLEPKFASVVTSLAVAEGMGRNLDPQLDLLAAALPIVLAAAT